MYTQGVYFHQPNEGLVLGVAGSRPARLCEIQEPTVNETEAPVTEDALLVM